MKVMAHPETEKVPEAGQPIGGNADSDWAQGGV